MSAFESLYHIVHVTFLAGKNTRLTPAACIIHQRSNNMPNGLISLKKKGVGTYQTALEYEQSDRSIHYLTQLMP